MLCLALACRSGPGAENQVILSLKEINQLVTAEYVVNKIIKASDDNTWYKIGDRKILITCEASLKAGIDFSTINTSQIDIRNKKISLTLPHATLFSLNIKPEDIKVAYEEIGMLRSSFSAQERDMLTVQAEKQIQQSADSLGILKTAETNARLFITQFLRNAGYEDIEVKFENAGGNVNQSF